MEERYTLESDLGMASTADQHDYTGQNLSDRDFSGQNLSGYIFKNCTLTGTSFNRCTFDALTDFSGALFGKSASDRVTDFSGCLLTEAKFSIPSQFGRMGDSAHPSNLKGSAVPWALLGKTFNYVDLSGATIADLPADLSMIALTGVRWAGVNFNGKNLRNAHFLNCDLTGAIFTGATLDYASFIQLTNLTAAKLNNCSLYYVVFDTSTLTSADLSYATKIVDCTFLNTLLKGTNFDGNDLTTSEFSVPTLLSSDPSYITSFKFATITTDFLMINLQKNWQCMDLRNVKVANFQSIVNQLYNLQAQNSLFNNALSFANARMNGANFNNAKLNGASLNGASLNNAQMQHIETLQGNEMGAAGALFAVDGEACAGFLKALEQNDTAGIATVFQQYGYSIGKLGVTQTHDPVTGNLAWSIASKLTTPLRSYLVVQSPARTGNNTVDLLTYDQTPSTFSYVQMIGSYLQGGNFSNSILDHVQLFGAVVTYANLSNVDMTGAQLGENAAIFSLAQNDSTNPAPYDYASFLNNLENSQLTQIADLFQHYGYTIGSISVASIAPPSGAVAAWLIKDNHISPARSFTVAQMELQVSPPLYELAVYFDDAHPAVLDNSYMPGIVLTQANLTACSAQFCHLYNDQQTGSAAVLTQATLVEVQFDYSNLYRADFTQAVLTGASFTGANLIGAKFKTMLVPGNSGHKITFHSANLQGADFSAATIESVNFLNAAICLPLPAAPTETNGVWLCSAKGSIDPHFANYLEELDAASTYKTIINPPPDTLAEHFLQPPGNILPNMISVLSKSGITVSQSAQVAVNNSALTWQIIDGNTVYILIPGYDADFTVAYNVFAQGAPSAMCNLYERTDLEIGPVSKELAAMLKANSDGKIVLSDKAYLGQYQRANVWTVTDASAAKSYTLWWGVVLVGQTLNNVTFVRTSFPNLINLFNEVGVSLRPQTLITKLSDGESDTTTWLVDMGKNDAYYYLC
jgi:uncharacterized protein YjbI with pentapeptide repeats